MFFRAYTVTLSGADYLQIQLIGTADGPVKTGDRKYHLLKLNPDQDMLEIGTIKPEMLGKDLADTDRMRAAFAAHKDDPELFDEPMAFRRIKE